MVGGKAVFLHQANKKEYKNINKQLHKRADGATTHGGIHIDRPKNGSSHTQTDRATTKAGSDKIDTHTTEQRHRRADSATTHGGAQIDRPTNNEANA